MKHCNFCHKDEPEVRFYPNCRTECTRCLSNRRKACYRRSLAFYEVSVKLKEDRQKDLLAKIKEEELYIIDQAKRIRHSTLKLNYLPLFSSTHRYLTAIGSRY